jgi:NarL family two-component system response regulator YdfI
VLPIVVEQVNRRANSGDHITPRLELLRVLPCVDSTVGSRYFAAMRAAVEIDLLPIALASTLAYRAQSDQPDAIVIATEAFATTAWWSSTSLREVLSAAPTVLLAGDASLSLRRRAARSHIRSTLPLDVTTSQLVAAIRAAVEGLSVSLDQPAPDVDDNTDWIAADERFEEEPLAEPLTARETVVLRLMALGLGNKEIASRLNISEHTAKFHVSSVLAKLGVASRTEAVAVGIMRGLVAI